MDRSTKQSSPTKSSPTNHFPTKSVGAEKLGELWLPLEYFRWAQLSLAIHLFMIQC